MCSVGLLTLLRPNFIYCELSNCETTKAGVSYSDDESSVLEMSLWYFIIKVILAVGLFVDALYQVEEFFLSSYFVSFIINECWSNLF